MNIYEKLSDECNDAPVYKMKANSFYIFKIDPFVDPTGVAIQTNADPYDSSTTKAEFWCEMFIPSNQVTFCKSICDEVRFRFDETNNQPSGALTQEYEANIGFWNEKPLEFIQCETLKIETTTTAATVILDTDLNSKTEKLISNFIVSIPDTNADALNRAINEDNLQRQIERLIQAYNEKINFTRNIKNEAIIDAAMNSINETVQLEDQDGEKKDTSTLTQQQLIISNVQNIPQTQKNVRSFKYFSFFGWQQQQQLLD